MSAPKRIQLRRTKGWRKPEGAVVVSRPTRWGNPYNELAHRFGLDLALALYENTVRGFWIPSLLDALDDEWVRSIYGLHTMWTRRMGWHPTEAARSELAGRDLCCWCPLDQPCHADVLLEIANGGAA